MNRNDLPVGRGPEIFALVGLALMAAVIIGLFADTLINPPPPLDPIECRREPPTITGVEKCRNLRTGEDVP
jgi:hypothetical protein